MQMNRDMQEFQAWLNKNTDRVFQTNDATGNPIAVWLRDKTQKDFAVTVSSVQVGQICMSSPLWVQAFLYHAGNGQTTITGLQTLEVLESCRYSG